MVETRVLYRKFFKARELILLGRMSASEELMGELEYAWLSFYNLEQEKLETQRTVRHYDREHGRVGSEDGEYAEAFGSYDLAFEEAEWRIERFLDEAESFYSSVAHVMESLNHRNGDKLPDYFPTPDDVTDFDVETVVDDRWAQKAVKGFKYDPSGSSYSTAEMARGTMALVHRWQNIKDEMGVHVDPMLQKIDEVVDEDVPLLTEELERIEADTLGLEQRV